MGFSHKFIVVSSKRHDKKEENQEGNKQSRITANNTSRTLKQLAPNASQSEMKQKLRQDPSSETQSPDS